MTDVDIWYLVLLKVGFKFKKSGDFKHHKVSYSIWTYNSVEYKLFVDSNTEEVMQLIHCSSVNCMDCIDKQSFYKRYVDIFREVKLDSLV
jgi:hypothetical protein